MLLPSIHAPPVVFHCRSKPASLLSHADVYIPSSPRHTCQCDKSATKSASFSSICHVWSLFISQESFSREHLLNTDLAHDNVLVATLAASERSITGADPVCRASFSPSTLEETLTSLGFRSMQVACEGSETWAYYQRPDVVRTASEEMFFSFLVFAFHLLQHRRSISWP